MARRFPHLILILFLTGLSLSACLPAPEPVEPAPLETAVERTRPALPTLIPTPIPEPTATVTPEFLVPLERLDEIKILLWHPWVGELAREVDALVDNFNQTNEWGIHVMVQRSGSSMALAQDFEQALPASQRPHILIAPSEQLNFWYQNGRRLRVLNDFISDPLWGLSEQQRAAYSLVFWQQDQIDGLQLGIPAQRSARVFFYNLSWASELGFSRPPATLEDFRQQACAAAAANNAGGVRDNYNTGGWMVDTDGLTVYAWFKAFGLDNPLQGDPPRLSFQQPAALEALRYLRGMLDDGCAWFSRSPAYDEQFAQRRALYYSGSLLDLPLQTRTMQRMASEDAWALLPFPSADGSRPTVIVSGLSYGIASAAPEEELAAWLFVRWMSSAENQHRLLLRGGGLPLTSTAASLSEDIRRLYPQWGPALQWIPIAQAAPTMSDWRAARFVIGDAAWYALQFYVQPEQFADILVQIDETIREVTDETSR